MAVPVVIDCTQLVRDRYEAFVHTWWIVAVFADQINETGEHLSKQETDVGRVSGTWRTFLNNLLEVEHVSGICHHPSLF